MIAQYSPPGRGHVTYGDGAAWFGNSNNGMVTRIEPFGHRDIYPFDHQITAITSGDGVILVGFGKTPRNHT